MKKLIFIVFILLLLLVTGELSYILFLNANAPRTQNISKETLALGQNPAVNVNSLEMLSFWQKGVVENAQTTVTLKGVIIQIDKNGTAVEHGWSPLNYALKIRIKASNNYANDIFLKPEELKNTTFYVLKPDGTKEKINTDQLNINDNIEATLNFDMLKNFDNNFISAEIIKL